MSHIAIVNVRIALHKDNFGCAGFENLFQPRLQILFGNRLSINLDTEILIDLDHNGRILTWRRRRLIGRWWLRHERIEPMRSKWCDDHKDDQQHQQHIDKWSNVNIGLGSARATDCHCHMEKTLSGEI